jgi:hypothetical protein
MNMQFFLVCREVLWGKIAGETTWKTWTKERMLLKWIFKE